MKPTLIASLLSLIYLLSCKEKIDKDITGQWIFDEIKYTAANKYYNSMNEAQRKEQILKDDHALRGVIYNFYLSNTYDFVDGSHQKHFYGKYEYDRKKGELFIMPDSIDLRKKTILHFPRKEVLEVEDSTGAIFVFKRLHTY